MRPGQDATARRRHQVAYAFGTHATTRENLTPLPTLWLRPAKNSPHETSCVRSQLIYVVKLCALGCDMDFGGGGPTPREMLQSAPMRDQDSCVSLALMALGDRPVGDLDDMTARA